MFTQSVRAALVIAMTVGGAASVCAQPIPVWGDDEKIAVTLRYTDADIHSVAGAKSMAFRIRVAAAEVCGGDDPIIRTGSHFLVCRAGAIDRAVGVLNAPLVADALGRRASFDTARR